MARYPELQPEVVACDRWGDPVADDMNLAVGLALNDGRLIELFLDCPEEPWPLYALCPSLHLPAAKVRAFLAFVIGLRA